MPKKSGHKPVRAKAGIARNAALRRRAEKLIASRPSSPAATPEYLPRLVHELQVHEVELVLQNEELRATQLDLERSRDRYARLYHSAPIGFVTVGADETILEANQTAVDMFERDPEALVGLRFGRLLRPGDRDAVRHYFATLLVQPAGGTLEIPLIAGRRGSFHAQLVGQTTTDPATGGRTIALAISDVSRRRIAERALEESRNQVALVDREQRRLGADVHDGIGQLLTATEFLSQALLQNLTAEHSPFAAQAAQIGEQLRRATRELRLIARGLTPLKDHASGLMDALADFAQQIESMQITHCRFDCPRPVLVPQRVLADHLFRITQEAVNNALKHGRATQIEIHLLAEDADPGLRLSVRDNGRGFIPGAPGAAGIGLKLMQHRAMLINGRLTVASQPGKGTEVTCIVSNAMA